MLNGGGDGTRCREALSLIAPNVGASDRRTQVGVFACALGAATPTCIPGNVHHGGIAPVDTCRTGLDGGQMREVGYESGIPTGGSGQGNGKDRTEPVDYVGSKNQRDMKA